MGTLGRGTGRRLEPQERKTQIINVAARLIAERGYWGISLQDVASGCGITDTGVLHHFGSKERVLLAVIERRDEDDRTALAARLGVERSDLYASIRTTGLVDLCEAMMRRNAEQPEIVRLYSVLSAESLDPHHPAHDYFVERERIALETFAAARCDMAGDPASRARMVLAAMDGVQLRWLRDLEHLDLVDEWGHLAHVLLGGAPTR
ncbi:TetR/AcrR family transcriptional regulator [Cellulomonas sp. WB94]|uniref:TetR/AcrR family transcriptional regulator n=1 Tax=Cellulomonas sp. WB94 TaxID=2173174 RepID=UPI000D569F24|nr:TetR/AcrR family transcriptional regulator [Cellulomonas sp. WB94]PVU82240.1 TetR/AcrR family transcriptional regulator [Cellulomonas sp. WB94]